MDSFIEVIGKAILVEQVVEYRADLSVSVRAAQTETARSETGTLRDECVRVLRAAGIGQDELSEGGSSSWRPWFWKKKPGQETTYKILVTCREAERLYSALDALQPLFDNQRSSLSVSMLKPRFEASPGEVAVTRAAAIADAREQAKIIAAEAGVSLGPIVQVEEQTSTVGRSGVYGDQDWGGFAMAAAGGASLGEGEPEFERLEGAKRTNTIQYRVRFAIAHV
ncbi:MAG TPA: SIMPL domain-containing protein [Burkholderiales bacterium]|nr:SIMPL domain-containing protein [Burkholderiales bacterium]